MSGSRAAVCSSLTLFGHRKVGGTLIYIPQLPVLPVSPRGAGFVISESSKRLEVRNNGMHPKRAHSGQGLAYVSG
ncbi:hypothetical protein HYDPIDRAFT_116092 [Hydnomerulius pinastri MD-312]|uniref:Uncharacterized protein n=1 Tax=Hydnomerulius pinastri MD-312 TaxID=994086 RepID=A0A0C9WBM6_9AGAM|nr:hypothetical protein HYDPIDRAFT_116092 [Hydnomerulius pinastri MD-312]